MFNWQTLLSGVSSIAPMLEQDRANRRSRAELRRGNAEVWAAQNTADKRIGDAVSLVNDPNQAAATLQKSTADYTAAIQRARAAGQPSEVSFGGRAGADANATTQAVSAYGNKLAGQYGAMTAPILQRSVEGQKISRVGVDVGREVNRAGSANYLARMRAGNRQNLSPWVALLSKLGQHIGRNYQAPAQQSTDLEPIDALFGDDPG